MMAQNSRSIENRLFAIRAALVKQQTRKPTRQETTKGSANANPNLAGPWNNWDNWNNWNNWANWDNWGNT